MGATRHLINNHKLSSGFTIVELLIVVVVIAILAAIAIVAYTGITNRANQASMQSTLRQVATKLEMYKADSGAYPPSLRALGIDQVLYGNPVLRWAYTIASESFFLSVGSSATSSTYYISNTTGAVQPGLYSGHDVAMLNAGYPTRFGYTDLTNATYPGDNTEVQIGSVPTGSWMIVIFAYNVSSDPVPPVGWTALVSRYTTNTMQTSVYAKIKQVNDVNQQLFNAAGASGELSTNGVLLWGANSADIPSWIVGAFGDRSNNATPTTTLTPTVTIVTSRSLVLAISIERTTATEANYTSLNGVTPWIWIPQPNASKIQTIAVGYEEKANPGLSQAMTVTYPNSQNFNGTAVQVVIPPAS